MRTPKIVADPMTAEDVGSSFFDSTESCAVDAVSSALLICDAVNGWVPWTNQSVVLAVIWNSFIACSVMTVFGADVPLGNAPISSITGSDEPPNSRPETLERPGRELKMSAFGL